MNTISKNTVKLNIEKSNYFKIYIKIHKGTSRTSQKLGMVILREEASDSSMGWINDVVPSFSCCNFFLKI